MLLSTFTLSLADDNGTLSSSITNHTNLGFIPLPAILIAAAVVIVTTFLLSKALNRKNQIYLLDFACYKGKDSNRLSKELMGERLRLYAPGLTEETIIFCEKLFDRIGVGPSAYGAEALLKEPPVMCLEEAMKETETVIYGAVADLLTKTGMKVEEIGAVVTNCTIFNPIPAIADMIVNKFKLREDVLTYHLSGMGCTAGLFAIGLAKQILLVRPNTVVLVASTENLVENMYLGNDRPMLVSNCIFRVGGAAIMLSNRPSDRKTAKYELLRHIHTHTARVDSAYNCIFQQEDAEGLRGITITKDLVVEASRAMESNLSSVGSQVLPISEKLLYVANYLYRKLPMGKNTKPYVPNFRGCMDHLLSHVGGKPIIDELQKSLKLTDIYMESARMTLYRFGNTSSSSTWYGLAYTEAKGRVKKDDRLWQIAFGSGFKCCSLFWRALRTVEEREKLNPWTEEIDDFPVDMKTSGPLPYQFAPTKNQPTIV